MTQEQIKEYTLRISQANTGRLTVIIFELALENIKDAVEALQHEDMDTYVDYVHKAERFVGELIHGLNYNDDKAKVAAQYFVRAHKYLINARINCEKQSLMVADDILHTMKPYFDKIAKEDTDPAMMENTQKVYAGLTYGKNQLNETTLNSSSNRGFTV